MPAVAKVLSPRSSFGSTFWSILVHGTILGAITLAVTLEPATPPAPKEEFLDLGYQTFDQPPEPVQKEQKIARAPSTEVAVKQKVAPDLNSQELQDDKSTIAGTQGAAQPTAAGAEGTGTAASTPYYKIKPKYPRAALLAGIEGWVLMQIDITEIGEVENIRVIDGEQRNTFQSEARRAVSQWKYRPFLDASGKSYRKVDHQVRVDFKLSESDSASSSASL